MLMTVLATVLTLNTVTVQTDTTVKVKQGTRLVLNNFGGDISVAAWDKNALRVEAEHSARIQVSLDASGSTIEIHASSRRGIPGRVDYHINAPAWMPLALSGVYSDVEVAGTKSEVSAETVKGDVHLSGGEGYIKLSSVQGDVNVTGAKGRLELSSVNQGVSVNDVDGEISVEAINGDVTLADVRSNMIQAATVNGDVTFVGQLADDGRYKFSSHTGDLDVSIPPNINATISVATFNGEFESTFPIVLSESGKAGKRFTFTLGDGSAKLDLETFQGTINLRRAGSGKDKIKDKDVDKDSDKEK